MPLPPNWGVQHGVSYIAALPCTPPIDPPQPTNPFPFPNDTDQPY